MRAFPPTFDDYFQRLADLCCSLEVTDFDGECTTVDRGIQETARAVLDCKSSRSVVAVIGNGGSSAIAAHLQADLSHACGISTLVFQDTPILTAIGNDDGYEDVYRKQVDLWINAGDVLIAISSSGESRNILSACARSRDRGARVVTLSGFSPNNALRAMGSLNFHVNSRHYGFVELAHGVLAHFLSDRVLDLFRGQRNGRTVQAGCSSGGRDE